MKNIIVNFILKVIKWGHTFVFMYETGMEYNINLVILAFSFGLCLQGLRDEVLEDCNAVLSVNASNCKALYRKAKALSDLGHYREAYDAVAKCSLAVPQVWVNALACLFAS
jgi:hypothetical protein